MLYLYLPVPPKGQPVMVSPSSSLQRERVVGGIPIGFKEHTMVVDNPLSLILKIDKSMACALLAIHLSYNRWLPRIKHRTLSPISSSFYFPNTQHSVSRQAHSLPRKSLGRLPLHGLASHSYPSVSSHIPSFRRGLGRLYLSISFLSAFQSTLFCVVKDALLRFIA